MKTLNILLFLLLKSIAVLAQKNVSVSDSVSISKVPDKDTIIYFDNGVISEKVVLFKDTKLHYRYYKNGNQSFFEIKQNNTSYEYRYDCEGKLFYSIYTHRNKSTTTYYNSKGGVSYISKNRKSKQNIIYSDSTYFLDTKLRFNCLKH